MSLENFGTAAAIFSTGQHRNGPFGSRKFWEKRHFVPGIFWRCRSLIRRGKRSRRPPLSVKNFGREASDDRRHFRPVPTKSRLCRRKILGIAAFVLRCAGVGPIDGGTPTGGCAQLPPCPVSPSRRGAGRGRRRRGRGTVEGDDDGDQPGAVEHGDGDDDNRAGVVEVGDGNSAASPARTST